MQQEERKVLKKFDQDGDGTLNATERAAARKVLAEEGASGGGPRRPGRFGPGGGGNGGAAATPGPKVSKADVKPSSPGDLFDTGMIRTLFLDFENADWEKELQDFHNTDVDIPATLTVDGKAYPKVGVHFRGMSSYGMVGEGQKRSLNIDLDWKGAKQPLGGYRSLNLLNAHGDPSFLRPVLYSEIARKYLPAPKANWVRVVINGESWGLYVNQQQFDKDFLKAAFGDADGNRWKVPGSPNGRGSLAYLGDDPAAYKKIYDLKSKEDPKAWQGLIRLCKTLNETPAEQLPAALGAILDVEGALRFLALENVFINNDGYWVRTSDYCLYQDSKGRFHVVPHDMNETFSVPGGPGGPGRGRGPGGRGPGGPGGPRGGGPRVDGVKLDPLVAASDDSKPLLSKLLAVPEYRARYLSLVRQLAETWLDWKTLGPVVERYHGLIAPEVVADTRKLDSTEAFQGAITQEASARGGPPGHSTIGLKTFADQRRAYLLGLPVVANAAPVK
jgi:hypothetical protein